MKVKNLLFQLRIFFLKFREKIVFFSELFLSLISAYSIFLIIWRFGYQLNPNTILQIRHLALFSLFFFFIASSIRLLFNFKEVRQEKLFVVDIIAYILLFLAVSASTFFPRQVQTYFPVLHLLQSRELIYILLGLLSVINVSKFVFRALSSKTNPSLLFIYSFLFLILLGTGLLLLPNSHHGNLQFPDALFTATTSVCVTGLTTVDVAQTFTFTGQLIILFLIQIGGIGVMTFTSFFALSFMGSSNFGGSFILKDFLSEENLGNMFKTLVNIIVVTFIVEIIGAILILYSIHETLEIGLKHEIFVSVFHSISAFCNAGISVFHGNLTNPLVTANYVFLFWIAALIIFGGLGFPIVFNFMNWVKHFFVNLSKMLMGRQEHYIHRPRIINIHTRIVVYTTLFLLISGTVFIFFSEYNHAFAGMNTGEKLISSFFSAVTPRTAGFNKIDPGKFLPSSIIIIIILMIIGAGPMSTGGGLKVSTFAISILSALGISRQKRRLEIFGREIDSWTIGRAYATIVLYFTWAILAVSILSFTENEGNITIWTFEVLSAISTVGLSLNFSPELSLAGKYIIIATMFAGRIGILTFFSGIMKRYQPKNYRYPQAGIIL